MIRTNGRELAFYFPALFVMLGRHAKGQAEPNEHEADSGSNVKWICGHRFIRAE